jgi:hypothetical protein
MGLKTVLWIRIWIKWGLWIRIRIQEGENDQQTLKNVNKFQFLKCWMFFFERRRLLL